MGRGRYRSIFEPRNNATFGLQRQSTTLIVGQPESPATQLLFEDPVLLDQVGDNILLMPVHLAGNRQQECWRGSVAAVIPPL